MVLKKTDAHKYELIHLAQMSLVFSQPPCCSAWAIFPFSRLSGSESEAHQKAHRERRVLKAIWHLRFLSYCYPLSCCLSSCCPQFRDTSGITLGCVKPSPIGPSKYCPGMFLCMLRARLGGGTRASPLTCWTSALPCMSHKPDHDRAQWWNVAKYIHSVLVLCLTISILMLL